MGGVRFRFRQYGSCEAGTAVAVWVKSGHAKAATKTRRMKTRRHPNANARTPTFIPPPSRQSRACPFHPG